MSLEKSEIIKKAEKLNLNLKTFLQICAGAEFKKLFMEQNVWVENDTKRFCPESINCLNDENSREFIFNKINLSEDYIKGELKIVINQEKPEAADFNFSGKEEEVEFYFDNITILSDESFAKGRKINFQVLGMYAEYVIPLICTVYMGDMELSKKRLSGEKILPEDEMALRISQINAGMCVIDEAANVAGMCKIIENQIFEGRRLMEAMQLWNVNLSGEGKLMRLENAEFIRDNKAFAKRWNNYCYRHKGMDLRFDELILLLTKVLNPIAKGIESGVEFFGSWMPELQRYID